MIPEQLPKEPGIVFHVNGLGNAVAITASRNVAERCNPAKMDRAFKAVSEGDRDYFKTQVPWKTDHLFTYPEAWKRLVFLPMPFIDADKTAKILRKTMGIQAANSDSTQGI